MQRMSQQGHHRVETEETWRSTLDGAIRPLALGFETQMGPALLEGRFNGPAFDEALHHRPWSIVGAGREVGSWSQAPRGITDKHPADGQHGLANSIPHRGPAGHVQLPAAVVIPAHAYALPWSLGTLKHLRQLRQAL